jgi:hypothetical protein
MHPWSIFIVDPRHTHSVDEFSQAACPWRPRRVVVVKVLTILLLRSFPEFIFFFFLPCSDWCFLPCFFEPVWLQQTMFPGDPLKEKSKHTCRHAVLRRTCCEQLLIELCDPIVHRGEMITNVRIVHGWHIRAGSTMRLQNATNCLLSAMFNDEILFWFFVSSFALLHHFFAVALHPIHTTFSKNTKDYKI